MEKPDKICQHCGTSNSADALFCENCGTNLQNTPEQNFAPDSNYGADNTFHNARYNTSPVIQPVPNKPIPKWVPVLIAEIFLLALCIYGITDTVNKTRSPEHIAENYFVHMMNGNWEESYSELDVEDSEFINAKMYATIQEQNAPGIVTNYQVSIRPEGKALNELSQDIYQFAGDLGLEDYLEQGQSASSLEQIVQIDYRIKGDTENDNYAIPLTRTPEGWKVMASGYICKDYRIYVPVGASVSVDGILLGETYRIPKEKEYHPDSYNIPQIFYGPHEIKITMEDMKDVNEIVQIDYDSSEYRQEYMQIKEETLNELIQKAGENMQQIYTAAMAGKNFRTIENLFTSNEEERKTIKESYEYLLSDLNEGNYLPTGITFQDISGRADTSDCLVYINFGYAVDYRYKSWGEWKNNNYSDESNWVFQFVKENENWVQTNLGCETLYY